MPETGTGKAMETAGAGSAIGRLNCYKPKAAAAKLAQTASCGIPQETDLPSGNGFYKIDNTANE